MSQREIYTTPDGLEVDATVRSGTFSGYIRNGNMRAVARFLHEKCSNGPGGAYPKADGSFYFYCGTQPVPE